jgi:hypothetical protein
MGQPAGVGHLSLGGAGGDGGDHIGIPPGQRLSGLVGVMVDTPQ